MRSWIRRAATVAAALGFLSTAAAPAALSAEAPAKFKIGEKAPDFTLPDLGGTPTQLAKLTEKKVVVLAFWSLRCGACLSEIPALNKIHASWGERGAAVVSVVTDGVPAEETRSIMKESGAAPAYPVLLDLDFAVSDTYTNFIVPHTLVIDRKGVIRYQHTGYEPGTEKEYEAAVAAALAP